MWYGLIALAIIVVAGLAFYAGQLLWQVQEQKKQQLKEKNKRIKYLTDSISFIAKAMKEEQCEYSEGVLRIWVLLEHHNREVPEPKDYQEIYPGFASLYGVIKDMPTHEARKKYSKQDVAKMDMKRWRAEKEFEEQIGKDIEQLLTQF